MTQPNELGSHGPWSDGVVDGVDPGDALVPGIETDVEHEKPLIFPGHCDYVEAADVPSLDDEAAAAADDAHEAPEAP